VRSLVPISGLLIAHGMPDAVPGLFARQLKRQTDPRVLALALRLTSQALIGLEGIGDLTTARLTFANAKPLLERAVNGAEDAKSSLAMLEHVMGAMEVRAAELTLARPHLAAAVRLEPSFEALRLLAAVDRQQNRTKEALESLARMAKLSTTNGLALAETQLLRFEVARDHPGSAAEATQALEQALRGALKARAESSAAPGNLAGAERVLGRALEHYGQVVAARRAGIRGIEASRNDPDQLVTTVLDLARRALTMSDLEGSREALRVALEERLELEDLAYVAVWQALLERQQTRPALGRAREALLRATRAKGWPATVASWALGKLSDEQLRHAARRETEQVEATFYVAMSARVRGQTSAALEGLRQVANSEALELVEVTVARDLLGQQARTAPPVLPGSVEIP
jgi:tetratricopeptide (TPR) repeat protein